MPRSVATGSSAGAEDCELLGGGLAHPVADLLVAGNGQAGRGSGPGIDLGEHLGGRQAHLVPDLLVAGDR
jgi:hypothetical protein